MAWGSAISRSYKNTAAFTASRKETIRGIADKNANSISIFRGVIISLYSRYRVIAKEVHAVSYTPSLNSRLCYGGFGGNSRYVMAYGISEGRTRMSFFITRSLIRRSVLILVICGIE